MFVKPSDFMDTFTMAKPTMSLLPIAAGPTAPKIIVINAPDPYHGNRTVCTVIFPDRDIFRFADRKRFV